MATRRELIDAAIALITDRYVFPDVAEKVVDVLRRNDYEHLTDIDEFAAAVTADLQAVNGDKHLRLLHEIPQPRAVSDQHGFDKVEILAGNIGYLENTRLRDPRVYGDIAAASMTLVADTDALIIDLRRCRGGHPAMVSLVCAYLFDESKHVNDIYSRPDDMVVQFWTPHYVPGRRFGGTKPIWVLTSSTTFSGGEELAYDLQQTGVSMRIGRGRLSWLDVYSRLDYTFRFQRNDVHDNGGNPLYRVGKTNQFSITQTLSRNSTDNPIFPASGSIVSLTTEVSGGPLLPGNVGYHKWLFNAEWFTPLYSSGRLVLFSQTTLGYIDAFRDESEIPPIEYFYMGGTGLGYISTTALRGYDDRSVGPRDGRGEIGGRVLEKQTLELRLAVTLSPIPIYFLMFAEGGNVFTNFHHADFSDLKRSYGFGARLLINPIGLIGFDYGYGADHVLSTDGGPDGWRFHFQFGRGF